MKPCGIGACRQQGHNQGTAPGSICAGRGVSATGAVVNAKIRLPEHILGLWCYHSSWEGGVSYLRNDASAPKPSTPCTKDGDTDWIVIDADGSYHGIEWGCRAVRVTIIDRGVVIKGQPAANAVYGLDARCEGEGDTWRERARIEVERWGSALTIIRRKARARIQEMVARGVL
jgi:hypothetical protein